MAVGNILGGIATQTVVLVALDALGVRGKRPLIHQAASLVLVLEAVLLVVVLAVVLAGNQLPAGLILWRVTPGPVLIAVLWVTGLFLLQRAGEDLPWHESREPGQPGAAEGSLPAGDREDASSKGVSTAKSATVFGVAALAALVAGVVPGEEWNARGDRDVCIARP